MRVAVRIKLMAGALAAFGLVAGLCGCETARYYGQAIRGHYRLVAARRPIPAVLADTRTPAGLSNALARVPALVAFAAGPLDLPANGHYRTYVELGRRFVVWNLYAAPPDSLEAKRWWYPFVGRLDYRGYFSEAQALGCAQELRRRGLEVYVGGVEAYSTLGWFRDPVLSSFVRQPAGALAETLFHELAHQRLFVRGDADFNEAFATFVAREGVRRWFAARDDPAAWDAYQAGVRREQGMVDLVLGARRQLQALFRARLATADASWHARLPEAKARIREQLRRDYAALREQWGGDRSYDAWFAQPLNNAQLNTIALYYDLVPAFERLLRAEQGDLPRFYSAVDRLGRLTKEARHRQLRQAGGPSNAPSNAPPNATKHTPEPAPDPAPPPASKPDRPPAN